MPNRPSVYSATTVKKKKCTHGCRQAGIPAASAAAGADSSAPAAVAAAGWVSKAVAAVGAKNDAVGAKNDAADGAGGDDGMTMLPLQPASDNDAAGGGGDDGGIAGGDDGMTRLPLLQLQPASDNDAAAAAVDSGGIAGAAGCDARVPWMLTPCGVPLQCRVPSGRPGRRWGRTRRARTGTSHQACTVSKSN